MTRPLFIITADRGTLKVYKVAETPTQGRTPRLIDTITFLDAHGRYRDKFTDQAGAFPAGGGGKHQTATAERPHIEAENDTRIFRQLGNHITEVIRVHRPLGWSFAAPAEINSRILEHVTPEIRDILTQNVKHDLVKIEACDLLSHFEDV